MRTLACMTFVAFVLHCASSHAATAAVPASSELKPARTRKGLSILRPSALKVLVYPTNILSYARMGVLPYTAHAAATRDWRRFSSGFAGLIAADVLNAAVAKSLRQDSQLARSMDLVVDNIGNLIMAHELSQLYPAHAGLVWSIALVGLVSHWLQDKAAGDVSHVKNLAHMPSLVRRFYSNSVFFAYCVLGPKLLALGLVALKHTQQSEPLVRTAVAALGPSLILKTMVDGLALLGAMYSLAATHAASIESKYAALDRELRERAAREKEKEQREADIPRTIASSSQHRHTLQPGEKQRPPQSQKPKKR